MSTSTFCVGDLGGTLTLGRQVSPSKTAQCNKLSHFCYPTDVALIGFAVLRYKLCSSSSMPPPCTPGWKLCPLLPHVSGSRCHGGYIYSQWWQIFLAEMHLKIYLHELHTVFNIFLWVAEKVQQFQNNGETSKLSSWNLSHLKSTCGMGQFFMRHPWTSRLLQVALDPQANAWPCPWRTFVCVLGTWSPLPEGSMFPFRPHLRHLYYCTYHPSDTLVKQTMESIGRQHLTDLRFDLK